MPFRERSARAGLQGALEADGRRFVGEFEENVKLPGSAGCGVWASTHVVVGHSRGDIGGQSNIELGPVVDSPQDVNEALFDDHLRPRKASRMPEALESETRRTWSEN